MNWISQLFERIDDKKLMSIGLVSLLLGSLLAIATDVRFIGIMDLSTPQNIAPIQPFLDNIFNTALLALMLFVLGKIINPKTRFIDILNTAFICRIPFYFLSLLNINQLTRNTTAILEQNIGNPELFSASLQEPRLLLLLLLFAVAGILAIIAFAYLLYQGFKTATNLKKTGHIVSLIATVLVAEIISKFFVYLY
ncbi:YIP1 family protein [Flavobacterium sp. JP2137]|uniref:YIP1 family protein n=1 Tax=Flavobacterium sp. JP2137 TaxID=3414510 RepID=UPI003D2FC8C9